MRHKVATFFFSRTTKKKSVLLPAAALRPYMYVIKTDHYLAVEFVLRFGLLYSTLLHDRLHSVSYSTLLHGYPSYHP
jgi:hypothetical protein